MYYSQLSPEQNRLHQELAVHLLNTTLYYQLDPESNAQLCTNCRVESAEFNNDALRIVVGGKQIAYSNVWIRILGNGRVCVCARSDPRNLADEIVGCFAPYNYNYDWCSPVAQLLSAERKLN